MARIAGIDLPARKRAAIGLTYIYGIGRTRALVACCTGRRWIRRRRSAIFRKKK